MELSEQTERCQKFFGDALKLLVCEVPMRAFVYEFVALPIDGEKEVEMLRKVQFCGIGQFGEGVIPLLTRQCREKLFSLFFGVPVVRQKPLLERFIERFSAHDVLAKLCRKPLVKRAEQ